MSTLAPTAPLAPAKLVAAVDEDGESRFYTHPVTGRQLWRVTAVIGGTDYKPWIPKWYGTQSTKWCVDHLGDLARAKRTLGRDAAVTLGKDAAKKERDFKADAGTHVHRVLKALIAWARLPARSAAMLELPLLPDHLAGAWYDLGNNEGAPIEQVVSEMVDGFINFVCAFGDSMRIAASEMTVYNSTLGVAGTLDLIIILTGYAVSYGTGPDGADEIVASPGSVLVLVVDAKTGRALAGTWKEQIAAYAGMEECATELGEIFPMPETHGGAVLHLRPDYPDGWNLFLVSAKESTAALERFRDATRIFIGRQEVADKPGTAIRPLRADGTMPGPRLCDVRSEGYDRAATALRKAFGAGAELEDVARFTAAELLAVSGIGPKTVDMTRELLASRKPALYLAGEGPAAVPQEVAA